MTDAEELFVEEDANTISPQEVAAFLTNETTHTPGEVPEDIRAMLEESSDNAPAEEERVKIEPDKSFEENKRAILDNMVVTVRDVDIPITDEDKAIYLKCLLHSTPIELSVSSPNGITGKCRSLSVYESDVAAGAFAKYIEQYPGTSAGLYDGLLQQYRIAMQLIEYCGTRQPYLTYERGKGGSFEDHVDDLYEKSQRVLDVPGPVYGIFVRIMNIFQYKLGRLHEAAFNSDFWDPVGLD